MTTLAEGASHSEPYYFDHPHEMVAVTSPVYEPSSCFSSDGFDRRFMCFKVPADFSNGVEYGSVIQTDYV